VTRQVFKAKSYQHDLIDWALDNPRCGLWAGMGMGKTSSTLTALDTLELVEPGPALVVAPLRVAASTWPDEAKKWEHLKDVEVSAVVGTAEERRAALRRPATVYTTNYENLPWLVEHFGSKWPFRKIVADESTKLKGFRLKQGTQRARALVDGSGRACCATRQTLGARSSRERCSSLLYWPGASNRKTLVFPVSVA